MRTNRTQTWKEAGGRFGKASGAQPVGNAFSRLDLLAGIAAVVVLAALFALNFTGERGRVASCKRNLSILGGAMQEYASSHGGALPPASIAQLGLPWDAQILPHLPSKVVANGIDHAFQCPSDNVPRFRPRSYAMSAHNMSLENWPPGPDNETGVGLVWDRNSMSRLLGEEAAASAETDKDSLALVKLFGIPSPADTVYLTEAINGNNNIKDIQSAAVSGAGAQKDGLRTPAEQQRFHLGRLNYLMVDGHVETLSPLQTGSFDGGGGIWTVKKGN
jgi:prepilin-type processing-associated H-X9-DG protein